MRDSVKNTDDLASFLTDHSPIIFSCFENKKKIQVEAFGNLKTALLKMKNMFFRWKNLFYIL